MYTDVVKLYCLFCYDSYGFGQYRPPRDRIGVLPKRFSAKIRDDWSLNESKAIYVDIFSYDLRIGLIILYPEELWNTQRVG